MSARTYATYLKGADLANSAKNKLKKQGPGRAIERDRKKQSKMTIVTQRSIEPPHKYEYSYSFYDFEIQFLQKAIQKALPAALKKIDRQIDKIDKHPKNDGQVTFMVKRQNLVAQKTEL